MVIKYLEWTKINTASPEVYIWTNLYDPFNPKQISEIEGHAHRTWSSGKRSAVRYAEGLSARNTQGGQDEDAE